MNQRPNGPPGPDFNDAPDAAELERVWEMLRELPEDPSTTSPEDTDVSWAQVARRIGLPDALDGAPAPVAPGGQHSNPRRTESGRGRGVRTPWIRVAAALVLALGGMATWYSVPQRHTTPAGEQRVVRLPDGSTATLNAGSVLRHRRGFRILPGVASADRRVHLDGEAFFEVEGDGRPFTVEAGEASIRVLGTRFHVRARSWSRLGVEVHVEEGRVEVSGQRVAESLELTAGESARVNDAEIQGLAPRPGEVASWRLGGLTVVDLPLDEVLAELGLRFGVTLSLAEPTLGDRRLSVYYPRLGDLESVLTDLSTQQELQFRRTAEGWEIF